jgi:hypothetical protein
MRFKTSLLTVLAIMIVTMQFGCSAQKAGRTGFLSDYSKLKSHSDVSFRYVPSEASLRQYSKFIIDPVVIHLHSGSKAKGKISPQDQADIKNYMHAAIVKAISSKYDIAYRPGPGVARVKIALTDLKKSKIAQNLMPMTKMVGTGLGGASLEAEVVDSQAGKQIAALVESQLGNRLSLDGVSEWGDAKAIMDGWAKRFRDRLDEAHK